MGIHPRIRGDVDSVNMGIHPRIRRDVNGVNMGIHPRVRGDVDSVNMGISPHVRGDVNSVNIAIWPRVRGDVDSVNMGIDPRVRGNVNSVNIAIRRPRVYANVNSVNIGVRDDGGVPVERAIAPADGAVRESRRIRLRTDSGVTSGGTWAVVAPHGAQEQCGPARPEIHARHHPFPPKECGDHTARATPES